MIAFIAVHPTMLEIIPVLAVVTVALFPFIDLFNAKNALGFALLLFFDQLLI
jgi:hypothetical protein